MTVTQVTLRHKLPRIIQIISAVQSQFIQALNTDSWVYYYLPFAPEERHMTYQQMRLVGPSTRGLFWRRNSGEESCVSISIPSKTFGYFCIKENTMGCLITWAHVVHQWFIQCSGSVKIIRKTISRFSWISTLDLMMKTRWISKRSFSFSNIWTLKTVL